MSCWVVSSWIFSLIGLLSVFLALFIFFGMLTSIEG